MNLLLVRHGEAAESDQGDKILTPLGMAQITKNARNAAESFNFQLQNVYHSGKTRARQTAEILAAIMKSENEIKPATGLGPLDSPSIGPNALKSWT